MKYIKLFENFIEEDIMVDLSKDLPFIDIKIIEEHYLKAALFTFDNEDSDYDDITEFSNSAKQVANRIITKFLILCKSILTQEVWILNEMSEEQLGHDIWMSQNGHGSGFYDHGYDADLEKKLMDSARALGEKYVIIENNKLEII